MEAVGEKEEKASPRSGVGAREGTLGETMNEPHNIGTEFRSDGDNNSRASSNRGDDVRALQSCTLMRQLIIRATNYEDL